MSLSEELIGALCEIRKKDNSLVAVGRIQDITDSYIEVSNNREDLPPIVYNTELKLQVYTTNNDFMFFEGVSYLSDFEMLRITNIIQISNTERRNFFRIDVKETAKAISFDEKDKSNIVDNKYVSLSEVFVDNISLSGIHISTAHNWNKGDLMLIELPQINNRRFLYSIINKRFNEDTSLYGYGCELLNDRANRFNDDLCSYIFKMQRTDLNKE